MNIQEAILNGTMCEDCRYYDFCFYNRDCIAMEFLKKVAKINENVHRDNSSRSGDKA